MKFYTHTILAAVLSLCLRAESKEHRIVVNGSKASIDGVPITRTISYKAAFETIISHESAVRLLGPVERSGYGHNDLCLVWDSIGFHMLRDGDNPEDGNIWNFAVAFNRDTAPRPMDLKGVFSGSFSLNGISITSTTRLKDIEPKLVKQGFRTAQGPFTLCLDRGHYELVVGADEEGFVRLFIFRSNEVINRPKRRP